MMDWQLYRRSTMGPPLENSFTRESQYILREMHEEICRLHTGARALAAQTTHIGFYWPSILRETHKTLHFLCLWLFALLADGSLAALRDKERRTQEKKMSRQATRLMSSLTSKMPSFCSLQSRSFTAAAPKMESGTKMPTVASSAGLTAGGRQEERSPKAMTTKICIAIRSFENLVPGNTISGLPADTRKLRLPESRVLYTVLRSPHVDKKSREQFEMRIKKQFLVIKTHSHELQKKFFWLKRQRIFGAQYEIQFHCKTRLDKEKLQKLLL